MSNLIITEIRGHHIPRKLSTAVLNNGISIAYLGNGNMLVDWLPGKHGFEVVNAWDLDNGQAKDLPPVNSWIYLKKNLYE